MKQYLNQAAGRIAGLSSQQAALEKAAGLLADAIDGGGLIHIFGAQPFAAALISQVFYRGGGLAALNPILDPALDVAHGAWRSALCRELEGFAPSVLEYYETIAPGDCLLLLSVEAHSLHFREALAWGNQKGLNVVALLPLEGPPPGGCTLIDLGPPGSDGQLAAAFSLTLEWLLQRGAALAKAPPCWRGRGVPETGANRALLDEYLSRIRHL